MFDNMKQMIISGGDNMVIDLRVRQNLRILCAKSVSMT